LKIVFPLRYPLSKKYKQKTHSSYAAIILSLGGGDQTENSGNDLFCRQRQFCFDKRNKFTMMISTVSYEQSIGVHIHDD
jgi:hypothetical protein